MAFRLADAFGVQEIWLGGDTPAPPNRKISKTARSTESCVNYRHVADLSAALQQARLDGWRVLGLEITSESHSIFEWDFPLEQRLILVVGAENEGIRPETLAQVQACGHIPMYGRNSSLNVVTALAVSLGEYIRQQALKKD